MSFLIGLIFLFGGLYLLLALTVEIPKNHVGIFSVFGNRFYFGRKEITFKTEGLRFRPFPWPICKVSIVSLARDIDSLEVQALTRFGTTKRGGSEKGETAKVIFKLTIEWQPHQRPDLLRRFIELSSEAASSGSPDKAKEKKAETDPAITAAQLSLKDIIGKLCGSIDPQDAVDERKMLSALLNIYTRGSRKDWAAVESFFDLDEHAQDLLRDKVKEILLAIDTADLVSDTKDEHISPTEERLGIKIIKVNLTDVSFTKETEAAIQKKIQKAGEAKGAKVQWDKKRTIAQEGIAGGLSPERAFEEASMTMGEPTNRIVISGSGGAIPLLQVASGGQQPRNKRARNGEEE